MKSDSKGFFTAGTVDLSLSTLGAYEAAAGEQAVGTGVALWFLCGSRVLLWPGGREEDGLSCVDALHMSAQSVAAAEVFATEAALVRFVLVVDPQVSLQVVLAPQELSADGTHERRWLLMVLCDVAGQARLFGVGFSTELTGEELRGGSGLMLL